MGKLHIESNRLIVESWRDDIYGNFEHPLDGIWYCAYVVEPTTFVFFGDVGEVPERCHACGVVGGEPPETKPHTRCGVCGASLVPATDASSDFDETSSDNT